MQAIYNVIYVSMALQSCSEALVLLGDRVCQKMAWLMWPPPLNLRAGAIVMAAVTSPEDRVNNISLTIMF